jgi:SAM-dependent methyltransferase
VSKRDDDPQSDHEVGMTTAERRRRRRRGAGLRVPSDNVPRRSTPPVAAPVPEDPSLAMSIAYSFTSDGSEPVHAAQTSEAPSYVDPAVPISTVIDPPSEPVEQADFEMKTREMSAVDFEALGLADAQAARAALAGADGARQRVDHAGRVEPRPDSSSEELDLEISDVEEPAASQPQPQAQPSPQAQAQASPEPAYRRERLKTVALSEDDLEEVREVVRSMESADRAPVAPALAPAPASATSHGPPLGPAHQPPPAAPGQHSTLPGQGVVASPIPHVPSGAMPLPPSRVTGGTPVVPPVVPPQAPSAAPIATPQVPIATAQAPTAQGPTSSQPPLPSPPQPASPPRPPPTPPQGAATVARPHTPTPAPPVSPAREERSAAAELWGEDTPVPQPAPKEPARVEEPPRAEATPTSAAQSQAQPQSPPKPIAFPPPTGDQSNRTLQLSPADLEGADDSGPMPVIEAEASGEFEVDVEADDDAEEIKTQEEQAVAPERQPRAATAPLASSGIAPPGPTSGQIAAVAPPGAPSAQVAAVSPGAAAPAAKDPHAHPHAHPPPPPPAALHHHTKAPPTPPTPPQPAKKDAPAKPAAVAPAASSSSGAAPARAPAETGRRGKPWFVEVFDEDYLRTLPFLTPQATQAEAEFVAEAMGLTPGAQVLDVGCGYGRHAMELAARGFHVVGVDLSTPLLLRGGEEAQRRGLQINFVRGDMRELDFDAQFDGAYCLFSTFGYFDDETNKRTAANIAHALKPGGRVLIEILNRDYVIADLPTRVWWEGDGCVVLEEVELNYFSSRIQVNRSVVFDDGRQVEQEISIRAYSLHEVGKLMHAAGFRVLEVSGGYQTRGRFFGNQSRHIIVLAERKDPAAS